MKRRLPPMQVKKKELSQILSMGETKIDEFVKRGELHCYQIDGMVMFHIADAKEFVEKYRNPTTNNDGLAI